MPGAPKRHQEALAQNSKFFAQTRFGGPTLAVVASPPHAKANPIVKIEKNNFYGLAIEESVFAVAGVMQNLKAASMVAVFW